ncbi:MAG: transposase [Proteobacteria bacterium]|nr:transposase [Pseudomonadota bacterium]
MGTGRTDEFRKDAVRIALTSGLSRRQVADDLGVGLSTLNNWVNAHPTNAMGVTPAFSSRPCQKHYGRTPYPPFQAPLSIGKAPILFSRLILSAPIAFGVPRPA